MFGGFRAAPDVFMPIEVSAAAPAPTRRNSLRVIMLALCSLALLGRLRMVDHASNAGEEFATFERFVDDFDQGL